MTKSHALTPLKKCKIFDFLNQYFGEFKWLDFYLQGPRTQFPLAYFAQKQKRTNFPIFDQNPDLPFLKNSNFYFSKSIFFLDLNGYISIYKLTKHCFGVFCSKTKQEHTFLFLSKNHRLTAMDKC